MKSQLLYLLGTLLVVSTSACEVLAPVIGPDISRVETYKERVSYHRGSCFGRCPVYTLTLYENGLLVYRGERFTEREGTWQRTIDRRRSDALLDSFARSDFRNYPRAFRKQIADAASIDLSYVTPDGERYVTSYAEYAPPELMALDRSMQRLAELPGYRQVIDTIPGLFTSNTSYQRERQEAIVQLRPGVVAETWVVKYGKQNTQLKNRIAPNGNYYLISLDPNALPTEELLDRMRMDQDVLSVQLNQRVSPR